MIAELVTAFNALPAPTASFLGTLLGSSLSVLAVIGGALFNAHLNRKRDDRLRNLEKEAIQRAILSEMRLLKNSFEKNAIEIHRNASSPNPSDTLIPTSPVTVYPSLVEKLVYLDVDQTSLILDAYVTMDSILDSVGMLAQGNTRPGSNGRTYTLLPAAHAEDFAAMCDAAAASFSRAIEAIEMDMKPARRA